MVKPCKPVLGSKRTGLLAYKIGCMSLWDEWGEKHMVIYVIVAINIVPRKFLT